MRRVSIKVATEMNKHIYSVKTLVGEIRALLEDNYREIWVEGEISGLGQPASGHKYFSLKEGDALIRCALFKNRRQHQPTTAPAEGMQALVRGRLSVYESRGDMQLIVDYLEDAGEGALRREFEQLNENCRRKVYSTTNTNNFCRSIRKSSASSAPTAVPRCTTFA